MFVEDIRGDFYKLICGQRILVYVNYDIDAICAFKILSTLFRYDNTIYKLVSVETIEELVESFNENCENAKFIVLINCGGTIDIVETLKPEDDMIIFIVDSHKPTDVCNVYSSGQVRILGKPDENEQVPEFDEIFRDSDTEDENNDDDDNVEDEVDESAEGGVPSNRGERLKLAEQRIIKRRERRRWEETRNKLLFEYTQFSYYGRSSSILIFELAWQLGKDTLDCLWWAIVGITQQFSDGLIMDSNYYDELSKLQLHMSRLVAKDQSVHQGLAEGNSQQRTSLRISSEKELKLPLYRHWTIQASLKHSLWASIKLHLWTTRGDRNLNRLLAQTGLPLVQAKQMWRSIDPALRKDFIESLEKISKENGIENISYDSFCLTYGYRHKYQAMDYVYCLNGLLDYTRDKLCGECFAEALESLLRNKDVLFISGIDRAKKILITVFRDLQTLLDMKQVFVAGPFLYLVIQEGTPDSHLFSYPNTSILMAKATLHAYQTLSKNSRRFSRLPLVISVPFYKQCNSSNDSTKNVISDCLVIGIPPIAEIIPRSFFGKAFQQAAENVNINIIANYFDPTIIRISVSDRTKFFDSLLAILS